MVVVVRKLRCQINIELLKSKKFRAALIAAVTSVVVFIAGKIGLGWTTEEVSVLLSAIVVPILVYVGAEGYSEAEAKRVKEENAFREKLNNDVLTSIMTKQDPDAPK